MADDISTLFEKLQKIKEKELEFEKERAEESFKERVKESKEIKQLNAESRQITADSARAFRDAKKQEKELQDRTDKLQKITDTNKENYDKAKTNLQKGLNKLELNISETKLTEAKTELKELKKQSEESKKHYDEVKKLSEANQELAKETLELTKTAKVGMGALKSNIKTMGKSFSDSFRGGLASILSTFDQTPLKLLGGTLGMFRKGETGKSRLQETLFMNQESRELAKRERRASLSPEDVAKEDARAERGFFENIGFGIGSLPGMAFSGIGSLFSKKDSEDETTAEVEKGNETLAEGLGTNSPPYLLSILETLRGMASNLSSITQVLTGVTPTEEKLTDVVDTMT